MLNNRASHDREDRAMAIIRSLWGCSVQRFGGEANPFDLYCFDENRILAIAEVKNCPFAAATIGTKLVSVRKWCSLARASMDLRVPALLIVEFTDGWLYLDCRREVTWGVRLHGRKDRGLINDIEPCFMVPLSAFSPMDISPVQ